MRAMILAAGLGTRLRPLTYDRPKALIHIDDRPVIDHVIDNLARAGVDFFVINTFIRPEYMAAHMALKHSSRQYYLSHERVLLGTAGALLPVRHLLEHEPFFIHNADIVTDFDLKLAADQHAHDDAVMTLLIEKTQSGQPSDLGYDETGKVTSFIRKTWRDNTAGFGRFVGVSLISPEIFDFISGENDGIGDDLIPALLDAGKHVTVHIPQGNWCDIGTPDKLCSIRTRMAQE